MCKGKMDSTLALHPAAPGSIPGIPSFSEEFILDVAEVNRWRWLQERGQWLENVDKTHLNLASQYLKKDLS